MKNKYLVVIAGPTAVGKTGLSILLAEEFGCEIISADSRQIYKEMIIGTSTPDHYELAKVKHHFIRTVSIHDKYNASKFETDVLLTLENLFKKTNIQILTGGSGLYIDAVCKGIDDFPDTDPELRKDILKRLDHEGIESLRKELKILDPVSYEKTDLRNPKRIQKALEISLMTGKPYSSFLSGIKKERPFRIIKIGLDMERKELYRRINERTVRMMENGLADEAKNLFPWKHINALNTVGYKELFEHFDGRMNLNEAISKIQANTRKYARKQLTWLRKNNEYTWFHPEETGKIKNFIIRQMEEENE